MQLFLVFKTITNDNEPRHYSSYQTESLEGIFDTEAKALAKIDELHDEYVEFQNNNEDFYYYSQSARIEIRQLNN